MNLKIEPLSIVILLFFNIVFIIRFVVFSYKQLIPSSLQLRNQLLFISVLIANIFFNYYTLNLLYFQILNENINFRIYQIFIENLFTTLTFLSFGVILDQFNILKAINEIQVKKFTLYFFVFLKFCLIYFIVKNFKFNFNFYTLFIEVYFIAESILIIFISFYFLFKAFKMFKNLINDFIIDQFSVENYLNHLIYVSTFYLISFFLQIIYRFLFLFLIYQNESKFFNFLKDFSFFIKICHFILFFYSLQNILFYEFTATNENLLLTKIAIKNSTNIFDEILSTSEDDFKESFTKAFINNEI